MSRSVGLLGPRNDLASSPVFSSTSAASPPTCIQYAKGYPSPHTRMHAHACRSTAGLLLVLVLHARVGTPHAAKTRLVVRAVAPQKFKTWHHQEPPKYTAYTYAASSPQRTLSSHADRPFSHAQNNPDPRVLLRGLQVIVRFSRDRSGCETLGIHESTRRRRVNNRYARTHEHLVNDAMHPALCLFRRIAKTHHGAPGRMMRLDGIAVAWQQGMDSCHPHHPIDVCGMRNRRWRYRMHSVSTSRTEYSTCIGHLERRPGHDGLGETHRVRSGRRLYDDQDTGARGQPGATWIRVPGTTRTHSSLWQSKCGHQATIVSSSLHNTKHAQPDLPSGEKQTLAMLIGASSCLESSMSHGEYMASTVHAIACVRSTELYSASNTPKEQPTRAGSVLLFIHGTVQHGRTYKCFHVQSWSSQSETEGRHIRVPRTEHAVPSGTSTYLRRTCSTHVLQSAVWYKWLSSLVMAARARPAPSALPYHVPIQCNYRARACHAELGTHDITSLAGTGTWNSLAVWQVLLVTPLALARSWLGQPTRSGVGGISAACSQLARCISQHSVSPRRLTLSGHDGCSSFLACGGATGRANQQPLGAASLAAWSHPRIRHTVRPSSAPEEQGGRAEGSTSNEPATVKPEGMKAAAEPALCRYAHPCHVSVLDSQPGALPPPPMLPAFALRIRPFVLCQSSSAVMPHRSAQCPGTVYPALPLALRCTARPPPLGYLVVRPSPAQPSPSSSTHSSTPHQSSPPFPSSNRPSRRPLLFRFLYRRHPLFPSPISSFSIFLPIIKARLDLSFFPSLLPFPLPSPPLPSSSPPALLLGPLHPSILLHHVLAFGRRHLHPSPISRTTCKPWDPTNRPIAIGPPRSSEKRGRRSLPPPIGPTTSKFIGLAFVTGSNQLSDAREHQILVHRPYASVPRLPHPLLRSDDQLQRFHLLPLSLLPTWHRTAESRPTPNTRATPVGSSGSPPFDISAIDTRI
ncbi:hypothetical protein RJ55_02831 [Drechmeria coniospora]|nr:hypothetical protein RJ55_02831 [Drechmeria coniospora]